MSDHMISVDLCDEPGDTRRDSRWQDETSGAGERTARDTAKCAIYVAGARPSDGADGVDVAGDKEENGDGCTAADDKAEIWKLEEMRGSVGIRGWFVKPRGECGAEMAHYDHEGGDAAKALRTDVSD